MSKRGKRYQKKSNKQDSLAIGNDLNDSNKLQPDQQQAKADVVGYVAGFIAKTQLKRKIRVVDEFELMPDWKRKTRDNPRMGEKVFYGTQYFYFCKDHKPTVGENECESCGELVANEPLFTYHEPVCSVPGCSKPLPLKKFVAFEVKRQDGGTIGELKDDFLKAVDPEIEQMQDIDKGIDTYTKSFEWTKQFELVQFLANWKAELTATNDIPRITAKSFRQSNIGLGSFSPVFLVERPEQEAIQAEGNSNHDNDLDDGDLEDLGCHFDVKLDSYVRRFPSIAELISFMRQFGGSLRVLITSKGQKYSALPIITLSGGSWL